MVGDRGSTLSGGERQRMTFASALLMNPPILILDEATASLDSKSERQVQEALSNVMEGTHLDRHRTSVVHHPVCGSDHCAAGWGNRGNRRSCNPDATSGGVR